MLISFHVLCVLIGLCSKLTYSSGPYAAHEAHDRQVLQSVWAAAVEREKRDETEDGGALPIRREGCVLRSVWAATVERENRDETEDGGALPIRREG